MAETEIFEHYQVLKRPDGSLWELGRGAMGVTYKAFDTSLRCNVALKVINAAFLDSEMAQQRFLREARAAAGLSHPNVANVFHLGESGGNFFYAMEFIDGETLEAFVRRQGPLPPILALQITLQVTRALRAASREGLVHRDIKPANLMLLKEEDDDEVHVKVIDFGLAKVARKEGEASATITVAGFVGTPHFASPEQLEEKDLDVRSDMYSLGVSLWYMLAGKPPFAGSVVQIMSQHLTRRPPFEQLTGAPAPVVHLLEHLLEKDAAKRPQTASDLRREIEQVIRDVRLSGAPAAAAAAGGEGAAAPDAGGTSYPTEVSPEGERPEDTREGAARAPASGVVLANRYRLVHEAAQSEDGNLFQGVELDSGRAVAIKILSPDFVATPEQFKLEEELVKIAKGAPHPALLNLYSLERSGPHAFVTFEWVNGFTVLDLLRHRHALSVGEALQIIEPLASAADFSRARSLPAPDISPAHILLAFGATVELAARTQLLSAPMSTWPPFSPKVLPLALRAEPASSATWTGQQTIVPVANVAPGVVRQLALLTYELLGGSPGAGTQRAPLPALSEKGNAVLRDALQAAAAFPSACSFTLALRASLAAGRPETPARPASTVPPRLPMPVPMPVSLAPAGTGGTSVDSALAAPSTLPTLAPVSAPAPAAARPAAAQPVARPGPPPVPVPKAGRSGWSKLLITLVVIAIVGIGLLFVAVGLGVAAWKIFRPDAAQQLALLEKKLPKKLIINSEDVAADIRRELPAESPEDSASPGQTAPPAPTALPAATAPPMAPAVPFPSVSATAGPIVAAPLPIVTPAATTPTPTPPPPPDKAARFQELLEKAQTLDHAGDFAGALDAYVNLAQDYPEQDQGLSRVESFISAVRAAPLAPEAEGHRAQQLQEPMERAAGLGSVLAMLYLGDHLIATEAETAADWYRKAADKGEPEAMFALGNMYFKGVGVEAQPAEASKWFQHASDRGFVRAKIYLAECYDEGKGGVPRDFDKSFALLNEALGLDPNNAVAMEKLALDYERGRGTAVDAHRAFALTQRAVDLHDSNALGNLGVYYMKGLGVAKDAKKAVELFRQGADKHNAPCMFFYAQCLYSGEPGVPANRAEAASYYRGAAESGFPPARDWCQKNNVSFAGSD